MARNAGTIKREAPITVNHPYTLSPINSSARVLPGKITREAPPGPGMTESEFRRTMQNMADDAARWRWLRKNLTTVLEWSVETMTGDEFREAIDAARRA